ncbi:hypothetical protein FACS189452_08620 [Bacteroidia bacterium]|nr:hypothetical protein FACS189452_08620 [Bacteroidia bacterium]GHT80193.1 hypothetical protein FACS189467_1730 [Bacteroidia bacterium]
MEVSFSTSFQRAFRKRIQHTNAESAFWAALDLFVLNPFTNQLRTHKLSGKLQDLWSFSFGYDLRVVFFFTDDTPQKAVFVDVGTHAEVY